MKFFWIKIVLLVFLSLFLVGCGDDEDIATIGLEQKVLDDFSIDIPISWPLVSRDSEGVPKPSSGETVLIASATEPKGNVANNIVILKRYLVGTTTDKQYALTSRTGLKQEFLSYKEIESGDIVFSDEIASHYSIFQAQYNKNTPRLNYMQSARICNGSAFTITITLARDIEDFTRYLNFLKTFSCNGEK